MRKTIMLLIALILGLCVGLAQAGDKEDIEALIQQYSKLEDAGDMMAQGQLMTADRTWIGAAGGRRIDNVLWMKVQQEGFDNSQKRFPGLKFYREVRELMVRVYGTAAVASFYWYTNRIVPGDMPPEQVQRLGPPASPIVVTLVLVKQGAAWKIAHTHISPLYPPSSGQ